MVKIAVWCLGLGFVLQSMAGSVSPQTFKISFDLSVVHPICPLEIAGYGGKFIRVEKSGKRKISSGFLNELSHLTALAEWKGYFPESMPEYFDWVLSELRGHKRLQKIVGILEQERARGLARRGLAPRVLINFLPKGARLIDLESDASVRAKSQVFLDGFNIESFSVLQSTSGAVRPFTKAYSAAVFMTQPPKNTNRDELVSWMADFFEELSKYVVARQFSGWVKENLNRSKVEQDVLFNRYVKTIDSVRVLSSNLYFLIQEAIGKEIHAEVERVFSERLGIPLTRAQASKRLQIWRTRSVVGLLTRHVNSDSIDESAAEEFQFTPDNIFEVSHFYHTTIQNRAEAFETRLMYR